MTNERLPQRFRYQAIRGNRWIHGIVMVGSMGQWTIHTATGLFSNLVTDPGTEIRDIIGDVDEFQWIDNDYGWAGDVMVKSTWHPINPADPTTLPGDGDADERGMVWVSFSGDSSHSMSHWQCVTDRFVSTVTLKPIYATHWSPRIKQVPPEFNGERE